MRNLTTKDRVLVGLTLFSMFFGAGNLIFPPFLGVQAGESTWIAMSGFALSAIGFPILGVAAVSRAGGLDKLAGRVHPVVAAVFTLLIYLSIGPCLAIPRTASTSFEMTVMPFLGDKVSIRMAQVLYSVIFFAAAFVVARKPEKLTDRLGKIMTPCLLVLILIVFLGCLFNPIGKYAEPVGAYVQYPAVQGFQDGYQTMDTIAALNFGIIIALNIQARGLKEENGIVKETMYAGVIAGLLLLLIYGALAHIGAMTGHAFGVVENGAQTLNRVVQFQFGRTGEVILAGIFLIACLNTCIGLLSCCSEYFCLLVPSVSYRTWVFFFAAVSMVVSNVGLNKIMEISVPVLNVLYPVAIVLILLAFFHGCLRRFPLVYPFGIGMTVLVSLASVLCKTFGETCFLTVLIRRLPLESMGLEWVFPAAVGILTGIIGSILKAGIGNRKIQ